MVTQPGYQPDDNDEDFKRQFEKVADDFITSLRQEGHKEGHKEGRKEGGDEATLGILKRQLQLRLGRPLTDVESDHLRAHIDGPAAADIAERILTDSADQLAAWLERG